MSTETKTDTRKLAAQILAIFAAMVIVYGLMVLLLGVGAAAVIVAGLVPLIGAMIVYN